MQPTKWTDPMLNQGGPRDILFYRGEGLWISIPIYSDPNPIIPMMFQMCFYLLFKIISRIYIALYHYFELFIPYIHTYIHTYIHIYTYIYIVYITKKKTYIPTIICPKIAQHVPPISPTWPEGFPDGLRRSLGSLAPREAKLFCEALGGFGGSRFLGNDMEMIKEYNRCMSINQRYIVCTVYIYTCM